MDLNFAEILISIFGESGGVRPRSADSASAVNLVLL